MDHHNPTVLLNKVVCLGPTFQGRRLGVSSPTGIRDARAIPAHVEASTTAVTSISTTWQPECSLVVRLRQYHHYLRKILFGSDTTTREKTGRI